MRGWICALAGGALAVAALMGACGLDSAGVAPAGGGDAAVDHTTEVDAPLGDGSMARDSGTDADAPFSPMCTQATCGGACCGDALDACTPQQDCSDCPSLAQL